MAFRASLTGSSIDETNSFGIWSEGFGALSLVARAGNHAPGTASGINYISFLEPALNGAGQAAFRAFLTGSGVNGTNDEGIWSEGSGALALVAREGSQAAGTTSGVNYSNFSELTFNAAGQTAFRAFLTGSGVNGTNNQGIWSDGSGVLALVAREGVQAADTAIGVHYSNLFGPTFNASGQTAFRAFLAGSGVNGTNDEGIWSEGSGALALVARKGSQAPGMPSGVHFTGFHSPELIPPVLNAAGQTAFYATAGSDVDGTFYKGIWSEGSGTLALVARSGSPAPGTVSGVDFDGFYSPILNAAGQTAFYADLTGSGVDDTNNRGIWSEGSGMLALVARSGNQAPGTPSGVSFADFDNPYNGLRSPAMNAAGQTAFYAYLTGDDVDQTNDEGIWATDVDGLLHLIAREGDLLEVTPGHAVRTVVSLGFVTNTGNEDGRLSGFNDLGQIAFTAIFDDGSAGVFVSDQVAIPAPTTPGDYDHDGDVDGRDFLTWQRNPSVGDLADWQANYGMGMFGAASVPEPGSAVLIPMVVGIFFRFKFKNDFL